MKPNFALSLSFERLRLLHRAAGGWRIVGDVRADAEDLAGEIAMLRKTATALEPSGLRCKLLIPDEQIKYMLIETPDDRTEARREAARKALDGATPYAVDELVFDISAEGARTHIAAVARETLEEAERFAVEHRMHPVSFVAAPETAPFPGEPFFGVTEAAAELLEDDETVARDSVAVVILGGLEGAAAELAARGLQEAPVAVGDPAPQPASEETRPVAAAAEPMTAPATSAAPSPDAPDPTPAPEPTPAPQPSDPAPQSPPGEVPAPAIPDEVPPPGAGDELPSPDEPRPDAPQPTDPTPPSEPTPAPQPSDPTPETPPSEAPPYSPPSEVPPPFETSGSAAARTPPQIAKPAPISPSAAGASLTATMLGDEGDTDLRRRGAQINAPGLPPVTAERSRSAAQKLLAFASRRAARETTRRKEPEVGPKRMASASAASLAPHDTAPMPRTAPTPQRRHVDIGKVAIASDAAKPRALGPSDSAGAPPSQSAASEADRLTIFGARQNAPVGGKPRFLGLMLTAALLVFLAGVAAWASVFLDEGQRLSRLLGLRAAPEVVEAPVDDVPPLVESAAAATRPAPPSQETETEAEADAQIAALDSNLSDADTAELVTTRRPEVSERPPDGALPPRTDAEREAKYAVTGIWPSPPGAPPEPAPQIDIEDLYLTSIDPVSTSTDAVALPLAGSFDSDQTPTNFTSPAAAGTRFERDARGLVMPTEQGAVTPEGILVFKGRPAALPPVIPTRFEAPPEDNRVLDALARIRPKDRPGDLIETNERAQLDGLTRGELASIRPALRPRSVQEAAEEDQNPAVTLEDTDAAVTVALKRPSAFQNATALATQSSKRPDDRPSNFAKIVKKAERWQAAPAVVAPKIPSKTSVSRQATVSNAINLRKINLIGVYGKPSNRRALVRLSNGRYQKVEVGDRIDGGRVSAIGENELRYTKRGRSLVLVMPKG